MSTYPTFAVHSKWAQEVINRTSAAKAKEAVERVLDKYFSRSFATTFWNNAKVPILGYMVYSDTIDENMKPSPAVERMVSEWLALSDNDLLNIHRTIGRIVGIRYP